MNSGPACATADILVAPPPELRRSEPSSLLIRLLPVVMSVATVGVMVTVFLPGSPATRHPTFLAFPMMMLVSLVVTAVTGRGRRHVSGIHNDRVDYLGYLSVLRTSVTQTAAAQHVSLNWTHPDPATLWTLIGGPRMWERRPGAADFCRIRVGVGSAPLATRLVVGQLPPAQRADPVTRAALRCFLAAHATIADAPIAIPLRVGGPIAIDGDPTKVRGLLRAMICQLAVWHSPEELLIAGVVSDRNRAHWDWLKWLPHNQHPNACDALGPAPMVYSTLAEMQSQHPEFVDVFLAIGRVGRSLGMHLLLASQRLDEGRLRGLETHLSYRMCLKTWSASESRNVLGTQDAYQLPNTPGAGLLQTGTGELIRFQTAFVSGPLRRASPSAVHPVAPPSVRPFTTHAAAPVTAGPVGGTAEVPTPTVLHAVLDRLVGHGPAAHQVWLPPLDEPPMLGALLRDAEPAQAELAVPIGIVDRPFEQSRVPLTIDLSGAAGNVAVVGAPQTGKSTALRTLIMALAATHDAGRVQFYCLDFGGGALAQVDELPHVGAVAGRAQPQLASRMLAELESAVRFREAFFRDHGIDSVARYRQLRAKSAAESFADIFLVIDGWASLRQEFAALEESIVALAAQGLSFGVHVALSAARWAEIRPSLRDQIGSRIELRLADPADSELDRRQAQRVPVDRPGRGLSRDGMHMVIALPDLDGVALRRRSGDPVAPPIPLLPARVDYDSVVARAGDELGAHILLGLEERRGQPVAVDFGRHPHLLVLGDNECGKTAALRTLCREIVRTHTAARAQLLIVDFRHTLLDVIESEHMGGYVSSPAALGAKLSSLVDLLQARMPAPDVSQAQLRARSWWSGPDIYVVVDDYDLVAVSSGNPLMVLLEYLPHARDLGLHLVVARRSGGAARALFEPVLASLRDLGCRALLMSGRPDEGALFGSSRPMPLPPGRGILVTGAGDEQLVQVAWSPPP